MEIIVDFDQKRVLVDGVQMYALRRDFGLYDLRDMQGYYVQTGLLKPEIESAVRRLLGNAKECVETE